jgi:AcrR family transcriptional regulator
MNYELLNKLPDEKRKRIISISMEEFLNNGYSGASTNTITSKAGISKGLLFHYFGSKKELFYTLPLWY